MSNLNKILIIVLALQLGLMVFVFWPKETVQAGAPLFADLESGQVVKLTIHDNDGNAVVLAKNGDDWVLPEADDFPVQSDRVSTLLDNLTGIKGNRLVTQTEASHDRLQVGEDDFNRRVDIERPGGVLYSLYVGSAAGVAATHVRVDGQPEVYLADLNTFDMNALPSGWIDPLYVDIPAESVVGLKLENENGTFDFTKNAEGWTMLDLSEDEVFNEGGLTNILNSAATVRITTPLGKEARPAYGLEEPQATITLTYEQDDGSKTTALEVGAKTEVGDGAYYLKASDSPYYVTVSELVGSSFVESTRDDFLQEPPAEESQAEEPALEIGE